MDKKKIEELYEYHLERLRKEKPEGARYSQHYPKVLEYSKLLGLRPKIWDGRIGCPGCNKLLWGKQKYCSGKCRQQAYRDRQVEQQKLLSKYLVKEQE